MPAVELPQGPIRTRKVRVLYVKIADLRPHPEGKYVHFEGSWEAIFLGDVDWKVGDTVKITFEKENFQWPKNE